MKEETEFKPKPLVTIGGMPLLWHIMKLYSHYGYKDFVLCLGYKGEMIKDYFLNFEELTNDFTLDLRNRDRRIVHHQGDALEDWRITFVDTGLETMTGGRIARIKHLIDGDDFFLTYGDGVSDVNIPAVLDHHKRTGAVVTVTGVRPRTFYGTLDVEGGVAKSFKEKPTIDALINGGFKVMNRRVFDYLSDDPECVLEEEPMRRLAAEGKMGVYAHDGFWYAVDTHKQRDELEAMWGESAPWRIWDSKTPHER